MKQIITVLLLAAGAGACVWPEDFRPAEGPKPTAAWPEKHLAKEYSIDVAGQPGAKVRVNSEGAANSPEGTTIVHIAFEIENHLTEPLTLTTVKMSSADTDEGPLEDVPAMEELGDLTVAPGATGKSDVLFELPDEEVSPQNLDAFIIHWIIQGATVHYERDTPFVDITEPARGRTPDEWFSSSAGLRTFGAEGYPIRSERPGLRVR